MTAPSQTRASLDLALQQHDAEPAAAMVSLQVALFSAAATIDPHKDLMICDADGAAFILTLCKLRDAVIGKPYIVREVGGTNDVTLDGNGSETINGSANFTVTAGTGVAVVAWEDAAGVRAWNTIPSPFITGGAELLVANNLSDLASAATARTNLDVTNKILFTVHVSDLVGTNAQIRGFLYRGPNGTITKISSVLQDHALATGNATLTGKIGATGITSGVITITQSGSAVGDKDEATPSAANAVVNDDYVSFTVGGTNADTDAEATLTVEVTIT